MKTTLREIREWYKNGNAPEEYVSDVEQIFWKEFKRSQLFPELESLDEILNHFYLKDLIPKFIEAFPIENDLHFTGSWVRGTWRHPDFEECKEKCARAIRMGKEPVSDLDFWTKYTPNLEAKEKIREVGYSLGVYTSWVAWCGPAICLTTGERTGANDRGHISKRYKKIM